jgi:hypothetical protein
MTALVVALLLLATLPVRAATSGRVYKGTVLGYAVCTESKVIAVADNQAWTTSWYSTACTLPGKTAPAGYLGALANGYYQGGYCGTTGWWVNASPGWAFAVGSVLCANPPGEQTFWTYARSKFPNGQGGDTVFPSVYSGIEKY